MEDFVAIMMFLTLSFLLLPTVVMEEQIKQNEAQVLTLKTTIKQQDANIGKLQDTVAAQAEQIAANKAAQDEQKNLTDAKFAELYKALSALGQPLTQTEDPDPNRK